MKTNKEKVFEFIQLYEAAKGSEGITTQYLANALGIQRTNVSTLLGQLVDDGKLIKRKEWPVRYELARTQPNQINAFHYLVGHDGSLKHAIQQVNAAILYPQESLNILLVGREGTGKKRLAQMAYQTAKEWNTVSDDALFIVLKCANYAGSDAETEAAFWDCCQQAVGGVLFIEDFHLLSAHARRTILENLQKGEQDNPQPFVIVSSTEPSHISQTKMKEYLPVIVEIPPLSERPLSERFSLIQEFVFLEAARTKRTIYMDSELLDSLLLFDCEKDIFSLKTLIQQASMNAYMRELNNTSGILHLYISDFDHVVRKGFLNYRLHKENLEEIILPHKVYIFGEASGMEQVDRIGISQSPDMNDIDRKAQTHAARGFGQEELQSILSADTESRFRKYRKNLVNGVINREQLLKSVSEQLVEMTESFMIRAEQTLGIQYPVSIVFELCTHLDSLVKGTRTEVQISIEQITVAVSANKAAYSLALQFVGELEAGYRIKLSIDDAAIITLFLIGGSPHTDNVTGPSILFAFHGIGIASALSDTVETTLKNRNTFSIDLSFEQAETDTYQTLKAAVQNADRGHGVLAIHDLHILRQIFYTISLETEIEVRTISLPFTQLGIDWSRRATLSSDLDITYKSAVEELDSLWPRMNKVIVTLCTTSQGLATQLKDYLEQQEAAPGTEIIALSISDRSFLREQLLKIMQESVIQCVVGTYDPYLLAIPFIPAAEILGAPKDNIPDILAMSKVKQSSVNYDEIFNYLAENLEFADVSKMRKRLTSAIVELKEKYRLSEGSEIGLLVHIACAVNRLAGNGTTPINPRKEQVIGQYPAEYKELRKTMSPIEKKNHIIFPDDEYASILIIMKQL